MGVDNTVSLVLELIGYICVLWKGNGIRIGFFLRGLERYARASGSTSVFNELHLVYLFFFSSLLS